MIVEPDLPDHRKTLKLARKLALSTEQAVVVLLRLWGHCQTRKDDLLGTDADDVAACARWTGPAKKLLAALREVGWIDSTDRGFVAHGWRERNHSWLSRIEGGKKRIQDSRRNEKGQLSTSKQAASYPSSSQLAGANAGGEERRGEEIIPPTSALPRPSEVERSEKVDLIPDLIFAKKRIAPLLKLDPARPWSYDAETALVRIVPIPEDELRAVEWLHSIPADDPDRPKLRTSPASLCAEWQGEVAKARLHAARLGVNLDRPASDSTEKKEGAPADWAEWLAEAGYPPVAWEQVDDSVRREFRAWQKEGAPAA